MQDEFLRIQRVLKKSIVFITHDFLEALRIADRMAIMRDGRVVQIGTPEELILNPADDYVAQFTGEVPASRSCAPINARWQWPAGPRACRRSPLRIGWKAC